MSGRERAAAEEFGVIVSRAGADDASWVVDARKRCFELAELVLDPRAFRAEIARQIETQRAALRLPAARHPLP